MLGNGGKKRLLVSDNCGHCKIVKDMLKEEIAKGEIEEINIKNNKDAHFLAGKFGGVPTLLEEKDGKIFELKLE